MLNTVAVEPKTCKKSNSAAWSLISSRRDSTSRESFLAFAHSRSLRAANYKTFKDALKKATHTLFLTAPIISALAGA
jgi:hypothetical protein